MPGRLRSSRRGRSPSRRAHQGADTHGFDVGPLVAVDALLGDADLQTVAAFGPASRGHFRSALAAGKHRLLHTPPGDFTLPCRVLCSSDDLHVDPESPAGGIVPFAPAPFVDGHCRCGGVAGMLSVLEAAETPDTVAARSTLSSTACATPPRSTRTCARRAASPASHRSSRAARGSSRSTPSTASLPSPASPRPARACNPRARAPHDPRARPPPLPRARRRGARPPRRPHRRGIHAARPGAHRRRPRAARPPALHALDTPPEPVHEAALLVRTLYRDGTADVPAAELVAALDGFFADSTPLDAHATACCELLWAVGKTAKDRADVLAAATDGVAFRALAAPLPRALVPDVVRFARRLCAASPAFLDIGVSLAARHLPALIASRRRLATSSASASGQRPSAATRRRSTCAPSRSSLRR